MKNKFNLKDKMVYFKILFRALF